VEPLLPKEVDDHLTDLAAAQHRDQTLTEMEARAEELGFPIIGRAAGRFLELQARAIGARRVMELGSGYGYSAYWFARAVGEDGEVVCSDGDPENARLAESYLRRAGLWDRVDYHVGDALEVFAGVDGEFDIVYCDIDKDGYPDAWAAAADRVRVGGLFICDNVLWYGRVAGVNAPDAVTSAIVAMTRAVATDQRFVSSIAPIRDGVLVALRTE
jgi:caffeoyl-CoA O-methyltransferase